ncbi:hypothetical protein DFQ30_010549 [Apophysomyces sp. BC1015]|nr:hypothetical protein DFQ30_010549 [Apophysomyces sp. BC1015]
MMFKNRVKTVQRRLDTSYEYQARLEMLRCERQFLKTLGLQEDTSECERHLQKAFSVSQALHQRRLQNLKLDLEEAT